MYLINSTLKCLNNKLKFLASENIWQSKLSFLVLMSPEVF